MQKTHIQILILPMLVFILMACSLGGVSPSVVKPSATALPLLPTNVPQTTAPAQTEPTLPPRPPTTIPVTPQPAGEAVLVSKNISADLPLPPVKVSVEYPYLQAPAGDKVFNPQINSLVQTQIDDIKKGAAEVEDWRSKNMPQFFSELIMKYAVVLADSNFAAVRLEVSPFVAGAAHPNFFYLTVNYDLKQGRLLSLADLFKPGSNYLSEISAYCKTDLEKQGKQDLFTDGLAPNDVNFQKWNLTKDGLMILFDPYQVGSWAEGPQKVLIPYTKLQTILLPSGPVETLTNGM
jgi:hypothetical protein